MEKSGRKAAPPPEPTAVLRGHETAVNAVALCVPPPSAAQQQPLLVSGDAGGAVCLWSLRTKRRLQVEPTAHSLTSGRRATAASGSKGEGEGGVQQVAFVAGGQQVLTQGRGYSSCVKLWATERLGTGGGSGSTATFPVATLAFCKLAVLERSSSSDDSVLFAVYGEEEGRRGEGEAVALWDLRTRAAVQRFPSPIGGLDSRTKTGMCMCLRLFNGGSADGGGGGCQTYLASLWENGQLYLWDSRKPSAPFASTAAAAGPEAKRMHDEPPLAFDLAVVGNGCGVRGVSGGADTHIGIFSAGLPVDPDTSDTGASVSLEGTAEVLHQLRPSDPAMEPITVERRLEVGHAGVGSVAIRGDQRIFATGGWDKRVRVWDFKRLRPLAILKAHAGPVNCVAFSNTDNLLVSGSADTRIACWSLY